MEDKFISTHNEMDRINFTEEQGFAIRELQNWSYKRGLVAGIVYSIVSLLGIYIGVLLMVKFGHLIF